ncbi:hypothetical protein GIB67_033240 [Kingdonia uniflora]|uniref:Transcription factor 25 n=1 Tax=Kingdonia uniflora TaxID=39325 RepID=A0A7J7MPG1_9MAGN|nr:hypothetical protein GIB67_033240 [Kingdonia uniflora]
MKGDELEITDETSDIVDDEPLITSTSTQPLPSSNHKSKKKKNKKGKEKHTSNKEEDTIDAILQSLEIKANSSTEKAAVNAKTENTKFQLNSVKEPTSSILLVDPKFLRPETELRRIFGFDVVKSFESNNSSGNSRQIRGGRRRTHNPRKTVLVSPSDNWPRWDGSLSVELLETKDGKNFYKYVHSSSYSQAQRAFDAAKTLHDLNGIASVLMYHPYHIESLLTIADVHKFSGEHQSSADLISRCLFALECAWHPMFSPLLGNCQLKYKHDTNKLLFTVLFSYMQNMERRGCHRSALEVCKLLLSLDSDDPVGAMFCIDYFAIRSQEYLWLERFSEEYQNDNSLWLFPNLSYSLAICRFYLEHEPGSSSETASEDREKATSADLMKQALMLHPLVLKKIVAKAPLKDPAWTTILKHSFFGSAQAGGPSLEHLINIYVEVNYIVWRLPDLQTLLRDAAQLVVETLDHNGREAKDWACMRKEAFSSERNEYSHLSIPDFSSSVPTIPPEEVRNFMVDPQMAHALPNGDNGGIPDDIAANIPLEVADRNPIAVFLESLLPWNDFGSGQGDHHVDEGGEE